MQRGFTLRLLTGRSLVALLLITWAVGAGSAPLRAADPAPPDPAKAAAPDQPAVPPAPAQPDPAPVPPAPPAAPEPAPAPQPAVPFINSVEDAEARTAGVETAKKLAKPLVVKLENIPLRDALAHLSEQADVDIFTDWNALGAADVNLDSNVNVILAHPTPADQILQLVLRSAGGSKIDCSLDRGVVFVSTREAVSRITVTRTYDVTDLLEKGEDPGEMIQSMVSPGTWRDLGGDTGVVRQFNGKLLVTHTEPNQRQIEKLLKLVREPAGRPSKLTAKP